MIGGNYLYSTFDILVMEAEIGVELTYGIIYNQNKFELNICSYTNPNRISTEPIGSHSELWLDLLNDKQLNDIDNLKDLNEKDITGFIKNCRYGVRYYLGKSDANKTNLVDFYQDCEKIALEKLYLCAEVSFTKDDLAKIKNEILKQGSKYFKCLNNNNPGETIKTVVDESFSIFGGDSTYSIFNKAIKEQKIISLAKTLDEKMNKNNKNAGLFKI